MFHIWVSEFTLKWSLFTSAVVSFMTVLLYSRTLTFYCILSYHMFHYFCAWSFLCLESDCVVNGLLQLILQVSFWSLFPIPISIRSLSKVLLHSHMAQEAWGTFQTALLTCLYLSLDCEFCDDGLGMTSLPCTVHNIEQMTNKYFWMKVLKLQNKISVIKYIHLKLFYQVQYTMKC